MTSYIMKTTDDIMDFFLVFNKEKMYSKEPPFFQKSRLERELKQSQAKLADREEELKAQQGRIAQLQHLVRNMQVSFDQKLKANEDLTQSPKTVEALRRQEETLCLLKEELISREHQQSMLHETIKELDQEVSNLQNRLHEREKENSGFLNRIATLEDQADDKNSEIVELRQENKRLASQLEELNEGEGKEMDRRKLSTQKSQVEKLGDVNKNQEAFTIKETVQNQSEQTNTKEELEKTRDALKNYDWKLFCLETELDLWAKECKQLKVVNEQLNTRIQEMGALLNDKDKAISRQQEQNTMISEENLRFIEEIKRSQARSDQLMAKINALTDSLQEGKEIQYRLKEKDEQMNEIMTYLKQKINELDQTKNQELFLQNKIKKMSSEHEELQQLALEIKEIMAEKQEVMKVQQKRIKELQNSLKGKEQLKEDNRVNEEQIQELNSYKSSLERRLQQDMDQITNLTNMTQKLQIQMKSLYELVEFYKNSSETMQQKLNSVEVQLNQLNYLQEELEHVMNKLEHVKGENFNHKVAREQNERDISELQDQLERTNRNLADRIKEMTRTQFQLQMITKENEHFKKMNHSLKEKIKKYEESSLETRNGAAKLLQITKEKMNELMEVLLSEATVDKTDYTVEFEVLGESNENQEKEFSLESQFVTKKNEMKTLVEKFHGELRELSKRFDQ